LLQSTWVSVAGLFIQGGLWRAPPPSGWRRLPVFCGRWWGAVAAAHRW